MMSKCLLPRDTQQCKYLPRLFMTSALCKYVDYSFRFVGMGIIHTAKRYIVDELHEKLVNRMTFEKGRDVTQREHQQVFSVTSCILFVEL